MSSLSRELVFLILQFLDEEKFKESVHKLEQESGLFFNMKYFEEKVLAGEWEEVEIYLSGFTKLDDNRYSMKIYFEIRKQKYLEALDRHDRAKAVDILVQDLKVFSAFNEELYKEITLLLTLENFRENEQLSKYGDTKTARSMMLAELKKLFEANPLFREKLVFPTFKASRLRNLINQSLNWQHQLCKNPKPNPDIKTLFTDHTCSSPNGARVPSPVTLPIAAVSKPAVYGLPGALSGPFQTVAGTPSANALAGWLANANASSSVQTALIAASALSVQPNQASTLKQARTPSPGLQIIDYQSNGQEQLMKRLHSAQSVEEVSCPANSQQSLWSLDNLPRNVARTIHQGSTVTSMDFHPFHHTLLIVGCANGEIALWEVVLQERLLYMPFKIWNVVTHSVAQATVSKDLSVSVNHVAWSPEGSFIGIAFSKHLIHLYAHQAPHTLRQHIEIEAHAGGVNDLAFSSPYKQLCVVTCGDDKLIKVWTLTGRKLYVFEGHAAPVYSVCPHLKENIHFIFSTDIDGKIKAWLYDNAGSRVDYDAPGQGCTTMLYSTDGSRLFSCGTNNEGDSFLVEWNESEGSIKRTYSGFRKKAAGVVKVDTTQNQFLAAGEDNQIKFWDMDNTSMLASTDAEGELLSFPYLKFNKEGNLLAVTAENGFKILANAEGLRYLKASERRSYEISRAPADPSLMKSGIDVIARSTENSRALEDVSDKTKSWVLAEIVDPVQCQSVSMPDSGDQGIKVSRLVYTNLGTGILALGSNGVQKLWKWSSSEHNPRGKATAGVVPQHWQETMGSATTICSDKTGTLTLNQMTVVEAYSGRRKIDPLDDSSQFVKEVSSLLHEGIAQNTAGSVFTAKGGEGIEVSGSPTEKAILQWAVKLGMNFDAIRSESTVLNVSPFNSEKKRGGVALRKPNSEVLIHWKGAAEIVLASCTGYLDTDGSLHSIDNDKAFFKQAIDDMAARSLRCVAIAYRSCKMEEVPTNEEQVEEWVLPDNDLVLLAIIGIKDPCRPGVKEAVKLCTDAGVKVRMVTGDNIQTAKAIAMECGILAPDADVSEPNVIEGRVFRQLSEKEREQVAPKISVMGRSSPSDKLLLVQALRKVGEVVAVTGDGTNDAPALHEADIGLSMGIQGTEVAKESSDIIILDDNFASVVKVVRWGRSVYANIQKFIQFQLTVNVAALVINVVAAISAGDVPLNAVQLLWVNLIMDTLGALALATEPPTDHLMHRSPVGRREPLITNIMWRNLLVQALYQVSVLLVLNFSGKSILNLNHDSTEHANKVKNTLVFNAFVFSQIFNEFNARKPDEINVFSGITRNHLFIGIVGTTCVLQVLIIEFLGDFASTVRLNIQLWIVSLVIGIISWPLAAVGKLIPVPETPFVKMFIKPYQRCIAARAAC